MRQPSRDHTARRPSRRGRIGLLLLMIAASCWLMGLQITPDRAAVLVGPAPYQTFQRDWQTNQGAILLAVDAIGYAETLPVEVRWGDTTPQIVELRRTTAACRPDSITALADRASGRCVHYEGLTGALPAGQATLAIRLEPGAQGLRPGEDITEVPWVGIGDVFVLGGQSNSLGWGLERQPYVAGRFTATVYSFAGEWRALSDELLNPYYTAGSPWPVLAAQIMVYTQVPVSFIPTGYPGVGIEAWRAGSELYTFLVGQVRGSGAQPRLMLWHQGETDATEGESAWDYCRALVDFAARVYTDLQIETLAASLGPVGQAGGADGEVDSIPAANLDAIRDGIVCAWDLSPYVLEGPTLADVRLVDGTHFATDAELRLLAQHWFERLVEIGLPPGR